MMPEIHVLSGRVESLPLSQYTHCVKKNGLSRTLRDSPIGSVLTFGRQSGQDELREMRHPLPQ